MKQVTIAAVRKMSGATYLRMAWASWVLGVICAVVIVVTVSWVWAVVLGVALAFSAWSNLTAGPRVAARIEAKRR